MAAAVRSPEQSPCTSTLLWLWGPGVPCQGWPSYNCSAHGGSNCRQAMPTAGILQPVHPAGWPEDVESKSIRGIGFCAQVEPAGEVPCETKVPLICNCVPLFQRSKGSPEKERGCFWKHAYNRYQGVRSSTSGGGNSTKSQILLRKIGN